MISIGIQHRIALGESQTQEFKTSFDKACIASLVAFANTKGGTVWVGVTDKGVVQGVTLGKETLNEWLGQIKSATSPSLIPELTAHTASGKTVVAIEIAEFPVKPVNTRGRYYKRIASANHALALNEISDLYLQSLQISWDAHPAPRHSLEDLSPAKIERFIQQVNSSGRFALEAATPLAALQKLNYVTRSGQPTWAAVLLFATEPLRHHVHIGRFKTPSMIIDDRQLTDTLFEVVEQSMAFIVSHISVAFAFDGSIQRKERFAYPLPALREALLNAVVHRSYTDPSDVQIKIFDDRITIFSPGTLYGGISMADIQADNYRSSLRNKLVAEGFYLTKAIEKYGSGFVRMRKALQDYPEIDFGVKEFAGGVMVSFTHKQPQPQPQPESQPGSQPGSQPESSLPLEARVLHLLAQKAMGKREISAVLGQKQVSGQLNKIIRTLLSTGQIELTLPHKPSSRLQQYRIKPSSTKP